MTAKLVPLAKRPSQTAQRGAQRSTLSECAAQCPALAGLSAQPWHLPQHRPVVEVNVLEMQDLEIFACYRIRIALAQEAEIVGVLQFLDPRRITSELLVEMLDGAHVCGAAMAHFLFPVSLNLLFHPGQHGEHSDRHQSDGQHQCDENVAALGISQFCNLVILQFQIPPHRLPA